MRIASIQSSPLLNSSLFPGSVRFAMQKVINRIHIVLVVEDLSSQSTGKISKALYPSPVGISKLSVK